MIQTADIREWPNQAVMDPGGHKIGELESVYVDTSTGEPGRRWGRGTCASPTTGNW